MNRLSGSGFNWQELYFVTSNLHIIACATERTDLLWCLKHRILFPVSRQHISERQMCDEGVQRSVLHRGGNIGLTAPILNLSLESAPHLTVQQVSAWHTNIIILWSGNNQKNQIIFPDTSLMNWTEEKWNFFYILKLLHHKANLKLLGDDQNFSFVVDD